MIETVRLFEDLIMGKVNECSNYISLESIVNWQF